jgi:dipeptide/tripeptide permease
MENTEKKSFGALLGSFKKTFWLASAMELFERWAWYGLFAVFALYLTGSTDEGALGFTHTEKGQIMGFVTAILYFLPIFTGIMADKIGYKLSLIIAFLMLAGGYYMMGQVTTVSSMFLVFLFTALGAAIFKPVASAIVTKSTNDDNSTLGFGVFYMMVNIGGFIGPAMSSNLRTTYGWKLIFIQATVVILINLVIVLFFFKEPYREEKKEETLWEAIVDALTKILEAILDMRLTILLIIMVGFWTMFNQLFYTLPTFIDDWIDTVALHDKIASFSPWLAGFMSGGSEGTSVNPEMLINIDAGFIVLFQILVSFFVMKMRHINAMIMGLIVAAIGVGLTFYFNNGLYTILGIIIFAIGEMMSGPTLSSFIAIISPKGKEALYQGTYFLPVALGNFFTAFISGNLYQSWSDKLSLLQKEMLTKGIDMPKIGDDFTKNDYFAMASEKLGMTQTEMTQMVWDTYNPNKIWYVIIGIGALTAIALIAYDNLVVKPKEKKIKEEQEALK